MRRLWSWWTTGLGYGSPCDFLPQRTSGGSAPTTPRRRGLSPAIVGFIVLLSATVEAMVILGAIFPGSRNDHATRRAGQRDIMTVYVQTIINAVAGHHTVVYGLVGLLALSESLPIVGAVVPGTALIVGLSALVPSGALSVWPLVVAAILGAIVGDGLSFWCGHRYRQTLTGVWPFTRYPQLISRGEAFFQQHGGKSVFLARFTPGVRAVIPLVAGMVGMPVGRFYHVNILSALSGRLRISCPASSSVRPWRSQVRLRSG